MDDCCSTHSCGSKAPPGSDREPAAPRAHHIGDDCCSAKEDEIAAMRGGMKRVLQIVLAVNAAMFLAEFTAGVLAHSSALMADSVDMLGDALVYVLSLYALHRSDRWRAGAALVKGGVIAAFGVGVFAEVAAKILYGVTPMAGIMFAFGGIALAANLSCLALLYRYRAQDVNMSSTFECSRNDVIANVGVLLAAGGVYAFASPWPDILVGLVIAVIFFRSAIGVLRQAWPQFRSGVLTVPEAAE
jgi:Co/Zn/Cd efflux system component